MPQWVKHGMGHSYAIDNTPRGCAVGSTREAARRSAG